MIHMNYKDKMNEIRTSKDISQKEIAKVLAISPFTYSHYETQDAIIPIKHLNTFCNYFDVSIDYFFNLTDKIKYSPSNKEINLTLSGKRLKEIRKENKLTQEKLSKILNVARTIITEYEKGNFPIATHSLYTICKKYNISADYLLGKIDNPKTTN